MGVNFIIHRRDSDFKNKKGGILKRMVQGIKSDFSCFLIKCPDSWNSCFMLAKKLAK